MLARRKSCSPARPKSPATLYFCTSRGGYAALEVPLDDSARAAAVQVAEAIADAVAQPFLAAYPAESECAYCDYRAVCGPMKSAAPRASRPRVSRRC
jgi:hypothetical protein